MAAAKRDKCGNCSSANFITVDEQAPKSFLGGNDIFALLTNYFGKSLVKHYGIYTTTLYISMN